MGDVARSLAEKQAAHDAAIREHVESIERAREAHEKWGFVGGNLKNLDSGLCLGGKMVLAACEGPDGTKSD